MADLETKKCFGCNQPTSNYKYEPETMRYYGEDCLNHMAEHKLSPMEYNKCQGCGVEEVRTTGGVLKWWKVNGKESKLCFPCYQRTDEFKEWEKQEQEKKVKAEQEAKEKVEAEQANFKHKFNTTPNKLDPNKKYNCFECKKEIISNKDYDFFGVDLIFGDVKKHATFCDSCYFNKLKANDPQITTDYNEWHNPNKEPIPKTLKAWNKRWKIETKSKAEIKREAKEQAQNEARCLFCAVSFGWNINELDGKVKQNATEKTPQGFLICVNCLTGGELPDNQDLKMIRKSWEGGGLILTNFRKYPRPENLLVKMVEEGLNMGALNVYTEDRKIYLEATHGGITIELNVYLKDQVKKNWEPKTNYKGYFQSLNYECPQKHNHNIIVARTPFSSETPHDQRTYEIKNSWDNALSEYSDTNGYTMEEWEKDKANDQILKNCPTFQDYPKKGKKTDKIFNETDLKWIEDFENGNKEKF